MKKYSLKRFNTFGIEAYTSQLSIFKSETDLLATLQSNAATKGVFVLGDGSNILFTRDVEKLVLKNEIKGKSVESCGERHVFVKAGGGENWHDFIVWCLTKGFGGLENLSLIPGTVGASPIQNIGAYGVELKDIFHSLTAIHLETREKKEFYKEDCDFGYRQSIFKYKLKGQYCITSVTFKLTKTAHNINLTYGAIQCILNDNHITQPTIQNIHEAVVHIRKSKLPDPSVLGNAGSFFKNPEIATPLFESIKEAFPGIPSYIGQNGLVKLPAGWLIEQCGWKGKRYGNTGCYENQALILVNYGKATGLEIKALAKEIIRSVESKFNITLEIEVNIV